MNEFNKIRTISDVACVSIVAIENKVENKWEYYIPYTWIPKSNLNSWNELQGKCITSHITRMTDTGFDPIVFNTNLSIIKLERIKFSHDNWFSFNVEG